MKKGYCFPRKVKYQHRLHKGTLLAFTTLYNQFCEKWPIRRTKDTEEELYAVKKKIQNGIVGALNDSKSQNLSYFVVFLPVRSVHRDAFRPRRRERSLAKNV